MELLHRELRFLPYPARLWPGLLVVLAAALVAVRSFCRGSHLVQHDLGEARAWIELNRNPAEVRQLEGDLALETRVDEACRRMHDDREPANATTPINHADQVSGNPYPLDRATEKELTRIQDEALIGLDTHMLGCSRQSRGITWVEARHLGRVKNDELLSETQIHAGRLDLNRFIGEWPDDQIPHTNARADIPIGEDHLSILDITSSLLLDIYCAIHIYLRDRKDTFLCCPGSLMAQDFLGREWSYECDREAYEKRSTQGGFSFTEEDLRQIFANRFEILSLRRMRELPEETGLFGKSFLWAGILRKVS